MWNDSTRKHWLFCAIQQWIKFLPDELILDVHSSATSCLSNTLDSDTSVTTSQKITSNTIWGGFQWNQIHGKTCPQVSAYKAVILRESLIPTAGESNSSSWDPSSMMGMGKSTNRPILFQIRAPKLVCNETSDIETHHCQTMLSETQAAATWQVLRADLEVKVIYRLLYLQTE